MDDRNRQVRNQHPLNAGNGLTDPAIQYGAYADYAYQNKLISKTVQTAVNTAYPTCKAAINACNSHPKWHGECLAAHAFCQVWVLRLCVGAVSSLQVVFVLKSMYTYMHVAQT
jgi:carboxypeptidase C (cathepsin A)